MRRATVASIALAAVAMLAGCQRKDETASVASTPASSASQAASAAAAASGPIIAPMAMAAPTDAQRSAGQTLATQGGGNNIAACSGCHGAQGEGNAATGFPRLAGQSYVYLLHELDSYANDSRKNPIMQPIAKAMSADQRQAGAAYYASLAPAAAASAPVAAAAPASGPAPDLKRAQQLAQVGDEGRLVQACANCHGPDGNGHSAGIPYIAGQHAGYLTATLTAWRDGSRNNDPSAQMPLIAKALADADVASLAAYFAGLPPPPTARDQDRTTVVASSASAVVSGPRAASAAGGAGSAGGGQATQGVGSEQGSPLTGGGQSNGPGGGSGGGSTGNASGNSDTKKQ
jgi:cytochrome c553